MVPSNSTLTAAEAAVAASIEPPSHTFNLPPKVWTTLITNTSYLSGLLTLEYSLRKVRSAYPLVVLYTDSFPSEGLAALRSRSIPTIRIPYLLPSTEKDYTNDPRFYDCWSKLYPFSLTQFSRIVQLDSDMLVVRNMDELMTLELDDPSLGGTGSRVFAASHACVCNPLSKPHYPQNWIPSNCAFTTQHSDPGPAQTVGPSPSAGLGVPNGGLQVVNPSTATYNLILARLSSPDAIATYDFADQSLLSDLFRDRWVALPYIYNALKTLRWKGVHDAIWRDGEVKNVHYILAPKPWDNEESWPDRPGEREVNGWWASRNRERRDEEKGKGIVDGF